MKKTYKAPKYKSIDLSGEDLMTQSPLGYDAQVVDENEENQFVKAQSRGNLWDDEW